MEHLLQKGIGEVMSADAFLLGNGRGDGYTIRCRAIKKTGSVKNRP